MYSLSLPLCGHVAFRCGVLLNIYDNLRFVGSQVSHILFNCCCVCGWKPFVVVCVVGLVFHFFVAPFSLLAVFYKAFTFNQDVSNWNTNAVIDMAESKCILSPSLWPRLPRLCLLNIRQLEFHRITILTRFVIFVFVCLKRCLFCCLWWVGLSFSLLHPLLQCFNPHLCSIRTCPTGIRGR